MKTLLSVLGSFLIFCGGLLAAGGSQTQNMFAFLSVRIKGGNGAVVAVAQNEFCIGPQILPVRLSVYSSDSYETDPMKMTLLEVEYCEDLDIFRTLTVTVEITDESYIMAEICYNVNGEDKYIQTETLLYNADGTRVRSG